MNFITLKSINRGLGLLTPLILLIFLTAGCGPSRQEIRARNQLESARRLYGEAKADPNVAAYAPDALSEAEKAMQTAEQAKDLAEKNNAQNDYKELEHRAYLSGKKSQIALTITEEKAREKEIEALNKEKTEVLLQKRNQELRLAKKETKQAKLVALSEAEKAERAKKEAEARTREAEQAKLMALSEAEKAEQAKKETEQARLIALSEAEKAARAKKEAEAREREAEEARSMALLAAEKAERAKKEAEEARLLASAESAEKEKANIEAAMKAQEAEQARMEAEARAREAEQARMQAEIKAQEAERARMEAAAKAEEAEKAKAEVDELLSQLSDLKAKQTDRGIVLTMGDVLFAFDKATLSPVAFRNVDKLAVFLQKHPNRSVLIEGHTDSVGSDEYNLDLSEKRANAVKNALVAKGVGEERITPKGYGKKYPVASNNTSDGRQLNRRVEVVVLNEGVKPETQFRE
jgi:outer membrane protein OmpA-like peptidoglycan-associated protein